ncbi:MAG TPA: DUF4235 domain-containing protein [Nocardioidaceae bacterium]|nr:DUF4235 domain-containing protein [Nocardioidaceae bacterium]
MAAEAKPSRTYKIFGTVSAIAAGVATKKMLEMAWKTATGHAPPANPEHPDVQWWEAVSFAVASGAAIGVARMLMARKTAEYYRKSTGHLPAGMKDVS